MTKKRAKKVELTADVILNTPSGVTVLDVKGKITSENVMDYRPSKSTIDAASEILEQFGFRIMTVTNTGLVISGKKTLFEDVFSIILKRVDEDIKSAKGEFFQSDSAPVIPSNLASYVKTIVFPEPPTFFV
jgi:hypothetical protein